MVRNRLGLVPNAARNWRERPAVEIGHAFQLIDRVSIGGMRGNASASAQQAGQRKRRQRPCCISTSAQKNIGDRGNNFDAPDVIDWDLHLPRGGESIPLPVGQIDDGIRHEGKRPAAHCCLNEARVDIEDPIGETVRRSGCAVVDLVGMQDVALAGQAMPRLAAVMKGLDASERDADRVGIVAMR